MKPYRTLASVRLFTGIVGLTDNQVKWRANCLKKIADSTYEIINEVVFKAGEVVGLDDPPKPYRKALECLESDVGLSAEPEPETLTVKAEPTVKKKRGPKQKTMMA